MSENGDENLLSYKVVLAGESGVGKSSIMSVYVKDFFSESTIPTIGLEFATKIVTLKDGTKIRASIFDTAGQEKYKSLALR